MMQSKGQQGERSMDGVMVGVHASLVVSLSDDDRLKPTAETGSGNMQTFKIDQKKTIILSVSSHEVGFCSSALARS